MIDNISNENKTYYIIELPITNKSLHSGENIITDNRMTFLAENLKLINKENSVKMNGIGLINELNDIKNSIQDLTDKMELLQKEIEIENNKKEWWSPEDDEEYYYVDSKGVARRTTNEFRCDEERIDNLNCFKTKEQTERQSFEELLMRKLKQFGNLRNEEIDWNDDDQRKYYLYFKNNEIGISSRYSSEQIGMTYFTSQEIAEKAIEEFKEDLIRYFTSDK